MRFVWIRERIPSAASRAAWKSGGMPGAPTGVPRGRLPSCSPMSSVRHGCGSSTPRPCGLRWLATTRSCGARSMPTVAMCSRRRVMRSRLRSPEQGTPSAAAVQAQQALGVEEWPQATPIRVRMGLHVGETQERGGDYFGTAVNRAARLMGLAHGAQVLVSLAVEEIVGGELPDGVALEELGEHSLKGLSRPERVFQLVASRTGARVPTASGSRRGAREPSVAADELRRSGGRAEAAVRRDPCRVGS